MPIHSIWTSSNTFYIYSMDGEEKWGVLYQLGQQCNSIIGCTHMPIHCIWMCSNTFSIYNMNVEKKWGELYSLNHVNTSFFHPNIPRLPKSGSTCWPGQQCNSVRVHSWAQEALVIAIFLNRCPTEHCSDMVWSNKKILIPMSFLQVQESTSNWLMEAMGFSRTLTVHPIVSKDFFSSDKLFYFFYKKLAGQIKQHHIFSLSQGDKIRLWWESVLPRL